MTQENNEQIKAIIFDVGGVLIRTFDHSGRRFWEKRLNLPEGAAEAIVLTGEMGTRAQRGEITTDELWAWAGEYLGLGDELEAFQQDFWRGDAVDSDLMELIKRLNSHYQTAIISNATDALLDSLENYGIVPEFDLIVGSAYEGLLKPDPAIYEITLARLGRRPEETVFIDDAPANISAAASLGMKTILFKPSINLAAELETLGVRVS
ncbi:MAG: HAD family phosphatase [Anaerolineae bacterium]|nr:HAD family phosphatase [Anaerolineae bacterium]HNS39956.1 HAD family phosphatase [Promineifilum sp.]